MIHSCFHINQKKGFSVKSMETFAHTYNFNIKGFKKRYVNTKQVQYSKRKNISIKKLQSTIL